MSTASEYITASAGLVVQRNEMLYSCEKTYLLADELLYEAKHNGRNRVVIS